MTTYESVWGKESEKWRDVNESQIPHLLIVISWAFMLLFLLMAVALVASGEAIFGWISLGAMWLWLIAAISYLRIRRKVRRWQFVE